MREDRVRYLQELSDDMGAYIRPEWVLEEGKRTDYITEDRIKMEISQLLGRLSQDFGAMIVDLWTNNNDAEYRNTHKGMRGMDVRILIRYPEK